MEPWEAGRAVAMRDALDGFGQLVAELAGDDWGRPTGCPGWDVHAVVSHVIGVEAVLTGDAEPEVEVPDGLAHVRDELGRYTESHVVVRRERSPAALAQELAVVAERCRQQLDGDLRAPARLPFGGTAPLARALGARAFRIWAHEQDVRRAVERPGHVDGPAARIGLEQILEGLAVVLPQRLAVEHGVLELRCVGAQHGTLVLDLETGERLSPPARVPPLATVELDFRDLVPLACGRRDAPDPGLVANVIGRFPVAADVLANLALTP